MAKSSKVVVLCVAFVLFVIGLGGISIYNGVMGSESGELDARMAEARTLGLPLEATDFDRKEPLLPEDNAATYLNQILALQREYPNIQLAVQQIKVHLDKRTVPSSPPLQILLPQVETLTQLALKAAQCKDMRFPRDWDLGPLLLLSEYVMVKDVVKRLMLCAENEATAGRFESCVERLRAIKQLADLLMREPTFMAALVSIAMDAIGDAATAKLASAHSSNVAFLKMLQPLYDSEISASSAVESLRGEVYMQIVTARNPHLIALFNAWDEEQMPESDPKTLVRGGIPQTLLGRSLLSKSLRCWNDMYRNKPKKVEDLRKWFERMDKSLATFSADYSRGGKLMEQMFPIFAQGGDAYMKNAAITRLTRAYLRILVDRAQGKAVPSETDPFTRKPLRYGATKVGFKLWSVGADGKDDGGAYLDLPGPSGRDTVLEFPYKHSHPNP